MAAQKARRMNCARDPRRAGVLHSRLRQAVGLIKVCTPTPAVVNGLFNSAFAMSAFATKGTMSFAPSDVCFQGNSGH